MLPGLTADTLSNIAQVPLIGGLGLILLAPIGLAIGRIFTGSTNSTATNTLGFVFVVVFGFAVVAFLFGLMLLAPQRHKQRAELEAGYTTMLREFDQVDGISSHTGLVVRPAKVPPTATPTADAITSGIELGPIERVPTPVQIARRVPGTFYGVLGSVAVFIGSIILGILSFGPEASSAATLWRVLALVGFVVGILALAIIPSVGLSALPARRYASLIQSHFAGSRVIPGSLGTPDILDELLDPNAPALPDARSRIWDFFVFDAAHLVIYSRHANELVPFLSIPRSRIGSGRVTTLGRNPGAGITVTKQNGGSTDLGISPGQISGTNTHQQFLDLANWIVDWANEPRA
jgi:hypothetical protein